jgi:2-polyprenyl-3-methyl-5-hydroxy-6-metoxy-1,4-benzoquinol methylase
VSRLNKTEPAGKGWYQIPGVQVGDRTLSEQLIGLEPLFELAPGKTILDLGCAEGLISLELMNAGAVLTHGVEAVGSRVDHAREHFQSRDAAFYHADLNEFGGAPPVGLLESYDIVLLLSIRFCRKFSFEAICGMISLHDQQCIMREHDDGDQF